MLFFNLNLTVAIFGLACLQVSLEEAKTIVLYEGQGKHLNSASSLASKKLN